MCSLYRPEPLLKSRNHIFTSVHHLFCFLQTCSMTASGVYLSHDISKAEKMFINTQRLWFQFDSRSHVTTVNVSLKCSWLSAVCFLCVLQSICRVNRLDAALWARSSVCSLQHVNMRAERKLLRCTAVPLLLWTGLKSLLLFILDEGSLSEY